MFPHHVQQSLVARNGSLASAQCLADDCACVLMSADWNTETGRVCMCVCVRARSNLDNCRYGSGFVFFPSTNRCSTFCAEFRANYVRLFLVRSMIESIGLMSR